MTIAAPFLYVAGGIFLGLTVPGFSKHHFIGAASLIIAGILIGFAATNTTLTIPRPEIHLPSTSSTP